MSEEAPTNPGFFERPSTVRGIQIGLVAACVVVFGLDLLPLHWRHPHFDFDGWPGFFALYGFFAYVGIVSGAKILRLFVMRPEDYYDE